MLISTSATSSRSLRLADAVESRADRLMRLIEIELGGVPETNQINRLRIAILGALLERIEEAVAEAKERTF